jgi:hypothetical protein
VVGSSEVQETLTTEREQLQEIGDSTRIAHSIEENEDRLKLIADLNFIVSPLIATVGDAITNIDVDSTVNVACSVLDECVRLAPKVSNASSVLRGDDGLRKFIGLFEHLGGNFEETNLALAYVGLTGHLTKPITFGEAVAYLTEINNSLYDIGALRPNIKESLDDKLNMIALKEAVDEIDKDIQSEEEQLASPEPSIAEVVSHDIPQPEEPTSFAGVDISSEDAEFYNQIRHASIDERQPDDKDNPDVSDTAAEIDIVASDIVDVRTKKRKRKPKELEQLSIFDDFEHITASSEVKEERGSAGV